MIKFYVYTINSKSQFLKSKFIIFKSTLGDFRNKSAK